MCERYQLSDRARAAIATSTLQDMEIVNGEDKSLVIDPSKLKRKKSSEKKFIKEFPILNLLLDCMLAAKKMQPRL